MIFGLAIQPSLVIALGFIVLALFVVVLLIGMRQLKVPGLTPGKRVKVHRAIAWATLVLVLVHALLAAVLVNGWSIG